MFSISDYMLFPLKTFRNDGGIKILVTMQNSRSIMLVNYFHIYYQLNVYANRQ